MSLLVVRHAHAGKRADWNGDDRLRPLSEKGVKQALGLADALIAHRPVLLLSSPALRCTATMEPLAEQLGVDVVNDDRLFEGAAERDVLSLLDEVEQVPAALCSHGDVIPQLLEHLMSRGMVPAQRLRCAKASTWVVGRTDDGWDTGTYVPAPGS